MRHPFYLLCLSNVVILDDYPHTSCYRGFHQLMISKHFCKSSQGCHPPGPDRTRCSGFLKGCRHFVSPELLLWASCVYIPSLDRYLPSFNGELVESRNSVYPTSHCISTADLASHQTHLNIWRMNEA